MEPGTNARLVEMVALLAWTVVTSALAASSEPIARDANAPRTGTAPGPPAESGSPSQEQSSNLHVQNTDIVQGDRHFPAQYSGPNSLNPSGEVRETVSFDVMSGVRLWPGAEAHVDGLMWQGFGLSDTLGLEAFPNGEAFRVGTNPPAGTMSRLFLRQTIGLGGVQEDITDDPFHLAGRQDVSRLTLTIGKISVKDIFDNNRYANDPRTQFLNWALMANEAWDYPADSLGYTTGVAAELNQRQWTLRYGFFQMPHNSNGLAPDMHLLEAWGQVVELERRYVLADHPGAVRGLIFLNRAHMGSYEEAVEDPARPADIVATRRYRYKYGYGLNIEQEIAKDIGVFSRLGWSDGQTEAWTFADVDRTVTLGTRVKGTFWDRHDDTFSLAGVLNGISPAHRRFFEAGGTGILGGDGALTYGWEKVVETYYDFQVWKTVHVALDYQFVTNPAYNRDRGPVSIFAARLHWEF